MDNKSFRKACFDLVKESNDVRAKEPDIADLLVKHDDNGLWIRFTAIGSLLDYCQNNETGSVFAYCIKGLAITMLILDAAKGDD